MEAQKSGLENLLEMVESTFERYRIYCPWPRTVEALKES
jgi:hypothetical protein